MIYFIIGLILLWVGDYCNHKGVQFEDENIDKSLFYLKFSLGSYVGCIVMMIIGSIDVFLI